MTPSTPITPDAPKLTTNDDWLNAAVRQLVSTGKDPGITYRALSLFLSGDARTPQEQALIDQALIALGPPPFPVPAGPAPTSPTPTPSTGGGYESGAPGFPYSASDYRWNSTARVWEYRSAEGAVLDTQPASALQ